MGRPGHTWLQIQGLFWPQDTLFDAFLLFDESSKECLLTSKESSKGCRVIIYVDCFLFLITLNYNNSCMCCVRSTIVIDVYNLNSVLLSGFLVFCTGNQVGYLLMI